MTLSAIQKKSGKKRVLAFGTFDIIHPGHIDFLKSAKKEGDELFVIFSRDATVQKRKGNTPHFDEEIRKYHVQKLGIANQVILGEPQDYLKIPKQIDPHVIVLGYDQEAPTKILKENFPQAKIVRLTPHFPEQFKSSKLRDIFPGT